MPKLPNTDDTGRPKASLSGIGVFLNKTCTIPLVRCDFESIKTAVESREEPADPNNPPPSDDPGSPTLRTSSRKHTVINYKKFLEEYADLPPSPPKRKQEVDLKRSPSKSRLAAEKYRKTDFVTKPLNVPKPVRRRVRTSKVTPSTSADDSKDVPSTQETIMKPATTQETQEAIEALLLLGTMGMPPPPPENDVDDNKIVTTLTRTNAMYEPTCGFIAKHFRFFVFCVVNALGGKNKSVDTFPTSLVTNLFETFSYNKFVLLHYLVILPN